MKVPFQVAPIDDVGVRAGVGDGGVQLQFTVAWLLFWSVKVKLLFAQGIEAIVTCCEVMPDESWPLGGLKVMLVPPIPDGANQFRFPGVLSLTVTAQV